MSERKLKLFLKYSDLALVLTVGLLITLMTTNFVFKYIPDAPSSEKRVLQAFPKTNSKDVKSLLNYATVLPSGVDAYFNDRFSFRNVIIQSYSSIKLFSFSESPSNRVIKGEDGWFYYNFENFNDYYFCKSSTSDKYLEGIYNDLKLNRQRVEELDSTYIVLISPNKETVYPEFLPKHYRSRLCSETRLSRLSEYFKNKELNFLDPTQELISKKSENSTYFKTDSHWNAKGAKISYNLLEKIFEKTKSGFVASDSTDYATESKGQVLGDLSNFMSVQNFKEDYWPVVDYYPKNLSKINLEEFDTDYKPTGKIYDFKELNLSVANNNIPNFKATNPHAKNNLKVVLFRDSFAWAMLPFFLNDFKEVYFLSSLNPLQVDFQTITRVKPDFVIQQFVERKLVTN